MFFERAAAAEEADDEGDGADADEDGGGVGDVRMRRADVDDALETDDGRMQLQRDAAADQCRSAQLHTPTL